jgi:hypothetical protein
MEWLGLMLADHAPETAYRSAPEAAIWRTATVELMQARRVPRSSEGMGHSLPRKQNGSKPWRFSMRAIVSI